MRAEEELILATSRAKVEPSMAKGIRDLASRVTDWNYILRTAVANGVGPLLYKSLKTTAADMVPQPIMANLQAGFYRNVAHNIMLEEQLSGLLKEFQANHIPAIPYKGPALATQVYRDVGLRVFGDLDILIQHADVGRAADLMVALGYNACLELDRDHLPTYVHNFNEMPFIGAGKAAVELQWEIAPDHFVFPIAHLEIWDDGPTTDSSAYRFIIPEKLLLILCVHGAKDSWERLSWICDISELLRTYPKLDWKGLLALARRMGCLRMLGLGLNLAHTLLEAAVPEDIRRRLCRSETIKHMSEQVRRRLFSPESEPPGVLETCLFYMRVRERVSDRIRFCARTMVRPVPGQWERLGYRDTGGRMANLLTHLATGVGYTLGLAKQKLKEASQARNS